MIERNFERSTGNGVKGASIQNKGLCVSTNLLGDFAAARITDSQLKTEIESHIKFCDQCGMAFQTLGTFTDPIVDNPQNIAFNTETIANSESVTGFKDSDERNLRLGHLPNHLNANTSQSQAGSAIAHGDIARANFSRRDNKPGLKEQSVVGPYRLLEQIGIGGMGVIFKAVHTKMKRLVALKIHPSNRLGAKLSCRLFEREIEVLGQFSHPNIVSAYDAGEADGYLYLAMELLEGVDLSHLMRDRVWPMHYKDASEIIRLAALALEHMHNLGIFHRDIKPANIMLSRNKPPELGTSVKLLDVGLARYESGDCRGDSITCIDQIMGTIDYMSQEQALDNSQADTRSDIYSLGATFFYLLTGQMPLECFECVTHGQKLKVLLNEELPSIRTVMNDLPLELITVVDRCLRTNPDERFQSARELGEVLSSIARGCDLSELPLS